MPNGCANPYCDNPGAGVREPTAEELELFLAELNQEDREQVINKQITFVICTSCGAWTATKWGTKKGKMVRGVTFSPFKYAVGEQAKVILSGKHFGKTGKIQRRTRMAKAVMPPPPAENVYSVVFEEEGKGFGFSEKNLVLQSDFLWYTSLP